MAKLASHRLNEVMEVLERSFFTAAGYDVSAKEGDVVLLTIIHKDFTRFSISLKQVTEKISKGLSVPFDNEIRTYLACIETPGDYMDGQTTELSDFDEFLRQLRSWTDRVKQTVVRTDGVQSQIAKMRDDFFNELSDRFKDLDEQLTMQDREDILRRLSELEQKLQEALAAQGANKEEIAKLHKTIGEMNEAAKTLPKKSLLRVLSSKLGSLATSVVMRELLTKGTKLLEDWHHHIPHQ